MGGVDGSFSQRFVCSSSGVPSSCVSPQRDNYASLRRENQEMKLEISRMRVRLTEVEREQGLMKQQGRMRGGTAGWRRARPCLPRVDGGIHADSAAAPPGSSSTTDHLRFQGMARVRAWGKAVPVSRPGAAWAR